MKTLSIGQRFPAIAAQSTDEQEVRLPDEVAGHTAVVIFYRGHW